MNQSQESRMTVRVGGKPISFLIDTRVTHSVLRETLGSLPSRKTTV